MGTFVTVLHIIVAFILIGLVLIQDTKSGSVGGAFGGGGSNSVLGATGAATLAQRLTRWTALIFAMTSIVLSIFSSRGGKSVVDSTVLPVVTPSASPLAGPSPSFPASVPSSSGSSGSSASSPTPQVGPSVSPSPASNPGTLPDSPQPVSSPGSGVKSGAL